MKTKILLYLIAILLFVGTPIIRAFDFDGDEVDSSISPFKKSRNFSVIDEIRGEDDSHMLWFYSPWIEDENVYSVYIWKHIYSDVYEIKSGFESDIDNFLAVANKEEYNLTNVKWRKDGRKHVKFECENLVQKLIGDPHMIATGG